MTADGKHRSGSRFCSKSGHLLKLGPIMPVTIRPALSQREMDPTVNARATESSHSTWALLDTGADATFIPDSVAHKLGLRLHDMRSVITATHVVKCPIYLAELELGDSILMTCRVVGLPPMPDGMREECFVGRDVMRHLTYIHVGPEDRFVVFEGFPEILHAPLSPNVRDE